MHECKECDRHMEETSQQPMPMENENQGENATEFANKSQSQPQPMPEVPKQQNQIPEIPQASVNPFPKTPPQPTQTRIPPQNYDYEVVATRPNPNYDNQRRYDPTKRPPQGNTNKNNVAKSVIGGFALVTLGLGLGLLMNKVMPQNMGRTMAPIVEEIRENNNNDDTKSTTPATPITVDETTATTVAEKALPSVISVYAKSAYGMGTGSGVVLDTDGNIITNYHVVEDAKEIGVTVNGEHREASIVGYDASSDIAVIKLDNTENLTPIEIGDSDSLKTGEWVMTVGSPFGLEQSVSAGIVSALSRNTLMQSQSGNTVYTNLIQTDATINPGNSGGALVNAAGQLVGINTLFSSDTESFAGIGFAIPGNYAVDIAKRIIAGEQITHAYIGLSMQTVTENNYGRLNLKQSSGAYIVEVAADGPAEKAGLKKGDIVIGIDDTAIESADDVIVTVRTYKVGDTVKVTYMRGDKQLTTDVTLSDDTELQKLQNEQNAFGGQSPLQDFEQSPDNMEFQQYQTPDDMTEQEREMQEIIDYFLNNR